MVTTRLKALKFKKTKRKNPDGKSGVQEHTLGEHLAGSGWVLAAIRL